MKRDDANPERVLPKTGGGVSSSSPYNWLASFHRDLMAGAVMGGVVHTIVAPIERAKLLLQTQESNLAIVGSGRRRFKGMFDCIFRTVREEGILSLWRGNGISVIRYYPSVALNFSLKDLYRNMLRSGNSQEGGHFASGASANFIAGAAAGCTTLILIYPLDIAHTRLAADIGRTDVRQFRGICHFLATVRRKDGIRGIYRGLPASLHGMVVHRGLYFGGFDTMKEMMSKESKTEVPLLKRWIAAQAVTTTAGLLSYPLDTVRPLINRIKSIKNPTLLKTLSSWARNFNSVAAVEQPQLDGPSSSFTFSSDGQEQRSDGSSSKDESIYLKAPSSNSRRESDSSSVTMPISFMTGSIVGKRFYKTVMTREADDGNGWSVMLDYRTLKTPSKRSLKLPTLPLAKAIAAEWEYQLTDGIRPFTMPLMRLACTALERVPLTRPKIVEHLMKKFNQDLVFCRAPEDNNLTSNVHDKQVEKIDPLLDWVASEFGFKPVVYSSFFGGKQEDGLVKVIENLLKKTDDCELAAIDAIAAAAHSLVIAIGIFRGKLQIEEAIELIRLEEDLQVDKWGLVEGGHDLDIADLKVQISSAAVFLGLSRRI